MWNLKSKGMKKLTQNKNRGTDVETNLWLPGSQKGKRHWEIGTNVYTPLCKWLQHLAT